MKFATVRAFCLLQASVRDGDPRSDREHQRVQRGARHAPGRAQEEGGCRQATRKNNAECGQDKLNSKQDACKDAREIKY